MSNNLQKYAVLIVLSGILFFPFLGGVHLFDWDEINFAECAREMLVSGDYLRPQIDFMPFWEKPPFFIWMQATSMNIFGIGDYAARFPNALIGVVTIVAVYYAGKKTVNEKMALWWAAVYGASWLPHLYFKSGIIDPTFNLFIFLSFFQVYLLRHSEKKWLHAILAGLLLGMAALTKGPAAILIALLALGVYIIVTKGLNDYKIKHLFTIAVCAACPFFIWITITTIAHGMDYGQWFLSEFVRYQIRLFSTEDSDHGGPFIYHFVVLLIGCFPASVFLFQYIGKRDNEHKTSKNDFTRWMWILFWVVLILFSIVKTKIVHYSSLCYFPLTYLAAVQLYRLTNRYERLKKSVKIILLSVGTTLALLITLLPVAGLNKAKITPFIADPFAVANFRANVLWSYAECLWGLLYLAGIWTAVILMKKDFRKGLTILIVVQIVIIQATILHFTPKIEQFTQHAAIKYFEGFEGKDVYVHPLGYRSYADLFYSRKQDNAAPQYLGMRKDKSGRETPEANEHWLLYGKTDKPTYFICKVMDSTKYAQMPQLQLIGSENGFVFFRKKDVHTVSPQ